MNDQLIDPHAPPPVGHVSNVPPQAAEFRRRMRKQRIGLIAVLALVGGFCVLTYLVPPDAGSFLPRCTLHETTGLHCPGCGGSRAVYALMHGDLLQAAAYNLYFVLALPFLLWWGGYGVWATIQGKLFGPPRMRPWLYTFIWVTLIAFSILRNINIAPFNFLAPHKL
jgi:Protein of unknown function (DUF2752)